MSHARLLRALASAALTLSLVACLSGKRISDIDAPPSAAPPGGPAAWSVPDGVAVTADERGSTDIDGLYPSNVPNDRLCCWIAPSANVKTREPKAAGVLILTVFVPEYPFFDDGSQGLRVILGGHTTKVAGLAPGVHRIEITLLPGARPAGTVTIGLRTDRTFVPANEHIDADTRHLGLYLLGIAFR